MEARREVPPNQTTMKNIKPLQRLLAAHQAILDGGNSYAYFELAYTRQTGWMAWICSKPREDDPNRKVLAKGQGSTVEEACTSAMESMENDNVEARQ